VTGLLSRPRRARSRSEREQGPRGSRSHTIFKFFTVFGRGLKAKMEVLNDDKSMKSIYLLI
jgi:hypothetical protein